MITLEKERLLSEKKHPQDYSPIYDHRLQKKICRMYRLMNTQTDTEPDTQPAPFESQQEEEFAILSQKTSQMTIQNEEFQEKTMDQESSFGSF